MKKKSTPKNLLKVICLTGMLCQASLSNLHSQTALAGTELENLWILQEGQWEKDMETTLSIDASAFSSFLKSEELAFYKDRGDFFIQAGQGLLTVQNAGNYFTGMKNAYILRYEDFLKTGSSQTQAKTIAPPFTIQSGCNPACDNLGFQNGTLSAWSAYYAVNSSSATTYNITSVTGGPAGSVTTAGGPDPNTGNDYQIALQTAGGVDPVAGALIPLTPPLGGLATRIGDGPKNGHGVGILSQSFTVSASNPILTVQFAVVLENPSHITTEQPFFQMEVLDQNGNPVTSCGQYFVVSGSGLIGFKGIYYAPNRDTVYCRPWSTAFVPLNAYIGQCITVRFKAADCALGAHFGYAYVGCACSNLNINATSPVFCTGGKPVKLTGPPGLATYSWSGPCISGPSNTQSILISCAGTYSLIAASTAGISCVDTLKITIPPAPGGPSPIPSFTANQVCAGSPTQFTNTSNPLSGTGVTFNWDFYNSGTYTDTVTNPIHIYSSGGFYTVKLHENNNGCATDTILKIAVDSLSPYVLPVGTTTPTNTSSCSACDGAVTLHLAAGDGPTYTISNNFNSYVLTMSSGGVFSGTGSSGGCANSGFSSGSGGGWTATLSFTGCLCPGAYAFYISTSAPVSPSKCFPGMSKDTINFTINSGGANITTNITEVAATCSHPNGSATVTGLGGQSPYTYTWSTGQTGPTLTGLGGGTYTVTVKDANGCVATTPVKVTNFTNLPATVTPFFVSCYGANNGSLVVNPGGGTAPYTYSWTPAATTTDSAGGLAPGTYSVTVTDALGCSGSLTGTIVQPSQIRDSITAQVNATCKGKKGSASVGVKGGILPYVYNWSNGTTAPQDTGLVAGTYTATITDANGCSVNLPVTITLPTLSITPAQTNVACNGGSSGTATVTVSGGNSPYTYSWTPAPGGGQGNNQATSLGNGTYTCSIDDANGCSSTQVFTITQPAILSATNTQTNVNCTGGNSGSAGVTVSGGSPAYTYSWQPSPGTGQGSNSAGGLNAGTYTCAVTDNHVCPLNNVFTITQPAASLSAVGSSVNAACGQSNGSATCTVSGGTSGYTYSWNPGGTTGSTAANLPAGSYTCLVTDAKGCVKSDTVMVSNSSGPTASLLSSAGASCNGSCNGNAVVTASGGSGTLTYSWNPAPGAGQGTASASLLCAGNYTCTILDANACKVTQSVVIAQPTVLSIASANQTNVSCNGGPGNGQATVTAGGGTPAYTYSWNPAPGTGQGTPSCGGLTPGNYTCTLTDNAGCTTSKTVVITQPALLTASIAAVPSTCNQANGTASVTPSGGSGSYTYSWSPAGGLASTTVGVPAGSYTCLITDSLGCTKKDTISLTNTGTLPVAVITPSSPLSFCQNDSTVLQASGGSAYSWSTGASTPSIVVKNAGTYTVVVTNSCGANPATVTVTTQQPPSPVITGGGGNICAGDSVKLTASGGGTYLWNNGTSNASIYANTAGTYSVTVTNSCGSVSTSASVTSSTVTALFTADTTTGYAFFVANFHNQSSPNAVSWTWDFGDGTTGNGANQTHTYTTAGTYTATLTAYNAQGCKSTYTMVITVLDINSWIHIPNIFTPNGDGTNDLFIIHSAGLVSFNAKIFDRWGVKLAELQSPEEGWDGRTLAGVKVTDGTYYYILQAQGSDKKAYDLNGFFMLLH